MMLTENTVNKLQEMKLSSMAKAFKEQLSDPNIAELSLRRGSVCWWIRNGHHEKRSFKAADQEC